MNCDLFRTIQSDDIKTNFLNTFQQTSTIAVTCPGISIPGFKSYIFDEDFLIEEKLATGGFADVFIGKITNYDIKHNYNNDLSNCVIKKAKVKIPKNVFIQEISLHEMFGNHNYFAKLLCFSEEPQVLVLKFYRFGTLNSFAFPEPGERPKVKHEYTIGLIFSFCKKITWSVNYMHEKGVIHNDIKLDNILLDGDDVEPIFTVITDFG